jgi:hypothetical protein
VLTDIPTLPSGVIGFRVEGKLAAEDYRDTLAPAVKHAAEDGDVRLVIVVPTFEGTDPEAVWEDAKMGLTNWTAWKRVAFVTDVEWMGNAMRWLGWLSPGEVRHFPLAEQEAAIAWAAG